MAEQENTGGEQLPQVTEIEQKALDQGWRPQEQWDGDPDAWRPAKEFLDRGELFKKIDDQNRTIKDIRRNFDELARHHSKVAQVEYQRALDTLKAQKREAILEHDADAVIEIDEKIAAVREAAKPAPVQAPPQLNPIFMAWKEKNSWYDTNEAMRAYADRVGNKLEGYDPQEILSEVERQVKKEFSHKFENPNRNKPSAVEGGNAKSGGNKETFKLTDEQRRMAQKFIKTIPGYTMEKYVEELKKVEGL